MSAESGVPTFRDAMHGLWARFDPQELASQEGWDADPARVWAWYEWRRHLVSQAQPHAGHRAIPKLAQAITEQSGRAVSVQVVTQNVDDLHERAGTANVTHLHGSLFAPRCSDCGRAGEFPTAPASTPVEKLDPPRCEQCQGLLRPGVVWFGESLPSREWNNAQALAEDCDVMLVVGTSGVVYPAASLPTAARHSGAWVAEINPTRSAISDNVNLFWETTAATGLDAILRSFSRPA